MSSVPHTAPSGVLRHRLLPLVDRVWPARSALHRRAPRRGRCLRLAEAPVPTSAVWTVDGEELRRAVDDAGF
jgi:hypothetical protein